MYEHNVMNCFLYRYVSDICGSRLLLLDLFVPFTKCASQLFFLYACRSFQVGREKFFIPWLLVVNRKSTEVPMIEVNLVRPCHECNGLNQFQDKLQWKNY